MAESFKAPADIDVKLKDSAHKYRKDLLMMPILALAGSLVHMTQRPGVRGKETVGEIAGDIQYGPYSETRIDEDGVKVIARELETFLGSVIKPFSPNSVWSTVWGVNQTQGEALKNVPMTRQVLAFLAAKLGSNLNKVLWSAKRNPGGTKSVDLFNGFDTITKKEIDAAAIDVSKGNKIIIEKITAQNAVDTLKSIYNAASDELQGVQTKLFIPKGVYTAYNEDYQATVGATPYNREYKKTFLEGSSDLCELVALPNKKSSPFIQLTTRSNMLVGYGGAGEDEKIDVQVDKLALDFISTSYFGTEFESISPERLMVATIDGLASVV